MITGYQNINIKGYLNRIITGYPIRMITGYRIEWLQMLIFIHTNLVSLSLTQGPLLYVKGSW